MTSFLERFRSEAYSLFRIVAGVTHASDGTVRIDGAAVGPGTRAQTAYLPETDSFYPWMSVQEQLEFLSSFYAGWDVSKSDREIAPLIDSKRALLVSTGQFESSMARAPA